MYNKVILMGRLTTAPELKTTGSGTAVCSFSIAVDRAFTSKTGERTTDFIDIVAWKSNAEFVCKYLSKGALILVEGSLQTRSYEDKNGNKRKVVEVVATSFSFTGEKKQAQEVQQVEQMNNFTEIDSDEDLPF